MHTSVLRHCTPASQHTVPLCPATQHPCILTHCTPASRHCTRVLLHCTPVFHCMAPLCSTTLHPCFPSHGGPTSCCTAPLCPTTLHPCILPLFTPFLFPIPHLAGFLPMLAEYCGCVTGTRSSWTDVQLGPKRPGALSSWANLCVLEKEGFLRNARPLARSLMVWGKPHE